MSANLQLKLVTPERTLFDESVDSVSCPTVQGQITVLPHHAPLIAALQPGEMIVRNAGNSRHLAILGGFVEVRPGNANGNQVVILADDAEHAEEIDAIEAEAAMSRAEELMKQRRHTMTEEEYAEARVAFQHHTIRARLARMGHHRTQNLTSRGTLHE
jgi:F-type H+-transporting ATPase subunit epsilon